MSSPWWVPNHFLEHNLPAGSARALRFADYPYANGTAGFVLRPPALVYDENGVPRTEDGVRLSPRLAQLRAAQVGVETGLGLTDGIVRLGLRARLQLPMRIQFDTDWSLFREHDREGVDVVLAGREHVSIRFAESSRTQFYSGVGPQHFCDARGCVHGIDFSWGFETFPGRPFLFAMEGSIGNLDQAFAPGLRVRVGHFFGSVEASLGWHQRWIGEVPLGGPCAGIAGWF